MKLGKAIMKLKTWVLYLIAAAGYLFLGIMNLTDKKYFPGATITFIGGVFIVVSIIHYKKDKKSNQIEVPDTVLKNMDIELRDLIAEGKKKEAIYQYRIVTGLSIKEAEEYVDLIIEENSNK
ncbi:DNA-binding protein [Clostridium vincentii]|uniref:Ribosomal protein L7/L12 C-terminal domain-containing protein n=1 Tax=Clostridium vincentii TaxID=52704 RepID=A0A2T0BIL0_9CLOT|nr:DNA-binding protein [Clostridium vincentii]PRR83728.1 hypothetical protein CLVI_06750 [Clostridium vincentii]